MLQHWHNLASATGRAQSVLCRLAHMQQQLDSKDQQTAILQQSVQSLQGAAADAQQELQQLHIQLQHARSAEDTGASERNYLQAEISTLQQGLQAKNSAAQSQQEALDCMSSQMQSKVGMVAAVLLSIVQRAKKRKVCAVRRVSRDALIGMGVSVLSQRVTLFSARCVLTARVTLRDSMTLLYARAGVQYLQ